MSYLSSCVNNLCCKVLVLVSYDFGKGVFNGRVIGVDKVTVNILDREGALACDERVSQLIRMALKASES